MKITVEVEPGIYQMLKVGAEMVGARSVENFLEVLLTRMIAYGAAQLALGASLSPEEEEHIERLKRAFVETRLPPPTGTADS